VNNIAAVTSGFVNLTDVVKASNLPDALEPICFGGRLALNANVTKYTEQSDQLFPEEILLDRTAL
jgi:hypothetical protein